MDVKSALGQKPRSWLVQSTKIKLEGAMPRQQGCLEGAKVTGMNHGFNDGFLGHDREFDIF